MVKKKYMVKIKSDGVTSTSPASTKAEGRKYIKDYKNAAKRLDIKIKGRKFSIVLNK